MASKFKPRAMSKVGGAGSLTPQLTLPRKGADDLNEIRFEWRKRLKRGSELLTIEAMGIMVEAIQKLAPDDVGGVKDYAKGLKVAVVRGQSDPVVLIFLEKVKRELTESDNEDTVVYIKTTERSPKPARVLQSYQPWPAALLPFQPTGSGVTVVSRQVSRSEVARVSARILSKKASIEAELNRAGARGAKVERGNNAKGTEVQEDLAFSVLRREFGIADKSEPHWRPAIKAVQGQMRQLGKKLVEYVMTGDEGVFSLPSYVSVSASEVTTFEPFQTKIANASGLK